MTDPNTGTLRGFLIGLMIAVGILMVALCGACTAFFTIGALVDLSQGHSGGEFSPEGILRAAGALGVPPTLVGGLLIWGGLRLQRRPKAPSPISSPKPPPSAPPPG
jgi:hypothetical protein